MKIDLKRLGEAVRFRRKRRGWSLGELSQASGISSAFISDLENGKGGRPNIEYLFLLAASLGTTMDALISRTLPPQQQDTEEPSSDIPVPPSLAEFARAQNLPPQEVQMLARLNYRGRRPKHPDAWRAIYEVIKLASK